MAYSKKPEIKATTSSNKKLGGSKDSTEIALCHSFRCTASNFKQERVTRNNFYLRWFDLSYRSLTLDIPRIDKIDFDFKNSIVFFLYTSHPIRVNIEYEWSSQQQDDKRCWKMDR